MADKEMIAATLAAGVLAAAPPVLDPLAAAKRRQAFISRFSVNSNAKPRLARPSRRVGDRRILPATRVLRNCKSQSHTDMKTGKEIWKEKFADFKEGYTGVISPLDSFRFSRIRSSRSRRATVYRRFTSGPSSSGPAALLPTRPIASRCTAKWESMSAVCSTAPNQPSFQ
jgi:hypothetical protein